MKLPSIFGRPNGSNNGFVFTEEWAERKRVAMVEEQLRRRGIRDERALRAIAEIRRHQFVPAEHVAQAYDDNAMGIAQGQTISQPYIVGVMTEALELGGNERVLDVGTGSGYQAAILARLAAEVFTIERDAELRRSAEERLHRLGLSEHIRLFWAMGAWDGRRRRHTMQFSWPPPLLRFHLPTWDS